MPRSLDQIRGKVHGRIIELAQDPGLSDGADVIVRIDAVNGSEAPTETADALRAAAGTWAEDGDELDAFIEDVYRARHDHRPDAGA